MQPYSTYRDSGIEWLGSIPSHWEDSRLGLSLARVIGGGTPDTAREDYWAEEGEDGVPWVAIGDMSVGGTVRFTKKRATPAGMVAAGLRVLPVGTVIYSMYASVGAVARLGVPAATNQAILSLVPKESLTASFLYWWLNSIQQPVLAFTRENTQSNLNAQTVRGFPLVVPPLDEQRDIAAFLDRETERIDSSIAKKRLLIERLQEYRTALITRTVTRGLPPEAARAAGLDPSPRLKPSGVEWLGDVPEHWDVRRLRFVASINDDALTDGEDPLRSISYVDISSVDATLGVTRFDEMVFEDAPSRARRLVQDGDTIVSTVRTYLRAIAPITNPKPEMVVSTGFAVVRPINLDADFASWVLREQGLVDEIVARSVGVSYPAINAPEIGNLAVPIPPVGERRAIADFLEMSTRLNDELRHQIENAIERLLEYRAALITAAVTGKIDVRGAATSGRGSVESRP